MEATQNPEIKRDALRCKPLRSNLDRTSPPSPPSPAQSHYLPPRQSQDESDESGTASLPAPPLLPVKPETTVQDSERESLLDLGGAKRNHYRKCQQRFRSIFADTWFPEILSWFCSLACFCAIIALLHHYSDGPIPRFSHGITIGTLVALFSTLSVTALMVPVSQGISQLKWVWFSDDGGGKNALDFERFDQASRGPWGCALLIGSPARGTVSSIGALISILVLAANAVTQQSIGYVQRDIVDQRGSARIPFNNEYKIHSVLDGPLDTEVRGIDFETKVAFLEGLSDTFLIPSSLPLHCSTGNCTWPLYRVLAVCSSLSDISDLITTKKRETDYVYENGFREIITSTLEGVGKIELTPGESAEMLVRSVGGFPASTLLYGPERRSRYISSKRYQHIQNSTVADFFVFWSSRNHRGFQEIRAFEINLHFCVPLLNSTVDNGQASTVEVVDERISSFEYVDPGIALPYAGIQHGYLIPRAYLIATPPDSKEHFKITGLARDTVLSYSRTLFNGRWIDKVSQSYAYNTTEAAVTLGSIYKTIQNWENAKQGLQRLADDLAMSLSYRLRRGSTSIFKAYNEPPPTKFVTGEAHRTVTIVSVAWAWLSLLAVLIIAGLVFLLVVMYLSARSCDSRLWRSSNLALLQALDLSRPLRMVGIGSSNLAMESYAESVELKLQRDTNIWKLVEP